MAVHHKSKLSWSQEIKQELDNTAMVSAAKTLADQAAAEAAEKASAISLTKFLYFPELPSELRVKVWNYAASEPRIVEFTLTQIHPSQPPRIKKGWYQQDDPVLDEFSLRYGRGGGYPSLLAVNSESRVEVLKMIPEWKVILRSSSNTKFFRQDRDMVYISFHHIYSHEIDRRMRALINAEPTFPLPIWVDKQAVPMLSKLKVLQWSKTVAMDREIMNGLASLRGRSLWHLSTWMIQCSFVRMEHMIVVMKDRTSVYGTTGQSGSLPGMFVPRGSEKGVLVRRREEDGKEDEEEDGDIMGGTNETFQGKGKGREMMGGMKDTSKGKGKGREMKGWGIMGHRQGSRPVDLLGDIEEEEVMRQRQGFQFVLYHNTGNPAHVYEEEEAEDVDDDGFDMDNGFSTDDETEPENQNKKGKQKQANVATKAKASQKTTQRQGFRPITNNTEYATHILEELTKAKAYLEVDPLNVRRTIPLDFKILSSE